MAKRKSSKGSRSEKKSVQGYFRNILTANPTLLETRSNKEILKQWLKDNPGSTEVPQSVKNSLANVKSMLRRDLRDGDGEQRAVSRSKNAMQTPARPGASDLGSLENLIDECVLLANMLDRNKLENVSRHLRIARRQVSWLMGEGENGE